MEGRPPTRSERAASAVDPHDDLARTQADHDARQAVVDLGIQQGLVVRPGDMLVLTVRPDVSMDEFHTMTERVRDALPGVMVVFVAADGLAVVRGDDDGPA